MAGMLYELKIKLDKAFLGNQRTKEQVRRFHKNNKADHIVLDVSQWLWALKEAADALGLKGVDTTTVRIPNEIRAPSLEAYVRKWQHKSGAKQQEMFESMRAGTVLTMDFLIMKESYLPENKTREVRAPTPDEVVRILDFIGNMIGLSPWGSHFGYGKFHVVSFEHKDRIVIDGTEEETED